MFHHIPALKFEPSPGANNPEEFLLYNVRIVHCWHPLFAKLSWHGKGTAQDGTVDQKEVDGQDKADRPAAFSASLTP